MTFFLGRYLAGFYLRSFWLEEKCIKSVRDAYAGAGNAYEGMKNSPEFTGDAYSGMHA